MSKSNKLFYGEKHNVRLGDEPDNTLEPRKKV